MSIKQATKKFFPFVTILGDLYRKVRRALRRIALYYIPRKKIFSWYFDTNKWGDDQSFSGAGSNLDSTNYLREKLPDFFASLNIESIVDAPCGDFHWMKEVQLDEIEYTGVDIVDAIISLNIEKYGGPNRKFMTADLCTDQLPAASLIFCRDALVHLSNNDIFSAIGAFKRSGATYLMTTAYPDMKENRDISTGMWRPLNFLLDPFNFPAPTKILDEKAEGHESRYGKKCMFLWRISDLP